MFFIILVNNVYKNGTLFLNIASSSVIFRIVTESHYGEVACGLINVHDNLLFRLYLVTLRFCNCVFF